MGGLCRRLRQRLPANVLRQLDRHDQGRPTRRPRLQADRKQHRRGRQEEKQGYELAFMSLISNYYLQFYLPLGGITIKPHQIRNHMWIFINCLIVNPSFDSQTKENMTLAQNKFGSKCTLSPKFFTQLGKVGRYSMERFKLFHFSLFPFTFHHPPLFLSLGSSRVCWRGPSSSRTWT